MESGVWSLARVWTALAREARPQVASMTCGLAEWWVMDQKVEAIMLCWRVGGHGGGGPLTADLGRAVRLLLMEKFDGSAPSQDVLRALGPACHCLKRGEGQEGFLGNPSVST